MYVKKNSWSDHVPMKYMENCEMTITRHVTTMQTHNRYEADIVTNAPSGLGLGARVFHIVVISALHDFPMLCGGSAAPYVLLTFAQQKSLICVLTC